MRYPTDGRPWTQDVAGDIFIHVATVDEAPAEPLADTVSQLPLRIGFRRRVRGFWLRRFQFSTRRNITKKLKVGVHGGQAKPETNENVHRAASNLVHALDAYDSVTLRLGPILVEELGPRDGERLRVEIFLADEAGREISHILDGPGTLVSAGESGNLLSVVKNGPVVCEISATILALVS